LRETSTDLDISMYWTLDTPALVKILGDDGKRFQPELKELEVDADRCDPDPCEPVSETS
jgi:hypothetical protein